MRTHIDTVLFDLDGTLVDTAPDMARAVNRVLAEEGREMIALPIIREQVSHGARALLELAFADIPEGDRDRLRQRMLDHYRAALTVESRLFPGMEAVLNALEGNGYRWGVVTNKPAWLTEPLLAELDLARRAACIVSGDTAARPKPSPDPLLHACRALRGDPGRCVYVGDAERDIVAGRDAGMVTFVALFGYLGDHDRPADWGADALLEHPGDIWHHLPDSLAPLEAG